MAVDLELAPKQKRPTGEPCCEPVVYPDIEREQAERMAAVAKALGDPIRLQLVDVLRKHAGKVCVCELVPLFDLSQPTVSHHLKVLREAGIVGSERQGLWAYYYVNPEALEELSAWLRLKDRRRDPRDGPRALRGGGAIGRQSGQRGLLRAGGGRLRLRDRRPRRLRRPSGFGAGLYDVEERGALPDAAKLASLGCGNPTAVAELHEGETVLDLGSGGGIDVLLSARRVGPTGKAYGLDMTDEMLELARRNQRQAGVENVEFLKGTIEDVPLPDDSVDVMISNCVINLSGDKPAVFREAARVLRPGRAVRRHRHRRRPGHGRGDAPRHGAVDGLHRGRADRATSSKPSSRGAASSEIEIERDPPRPRARRLGDHPGRPPA